MAGMPPAPARAEGEPTSFTSVQLWVYPEYDDPRLLIMLEGKIMGATPPATVRFLVPTGAEMYSAGSKDAQDKYTGGPPDRKASTISGWDEISYQVKTDIFRVEYYDSAIKGFPDKTISYDFRTLYAIAGLTVYVQQPTKSSNFNVLPKADSQTSGGGFTDYIYRYNSVAKDQVLHFDIGYTRSDTNPSVSNSGASGAGGSPNGALIAAIIGIAVVFGIVAFWKSHSQGRRRVAPSRRSAPAQKAKGGAARGRFCGKCGQRIEGSPRFCPNCGAKLQ